MMSLKIFSCRGGDIILPDKALVLVSRQDGGNLIVNPPREVWERSELNPSELTFWTFLVAATGKAMLDILPQLEGGCINYWEAGNWALNDEAEPKGLKIAENFRKVHLHLLGRSPGATDSSWRWGEAPKFPNYVDRYSWASKFERLSAEECLSIVMRVEILLKEKYEMDENDISPHAVCEVCGYPALANEQSQILCTECQ